jgi:hypothetical protein
MKENGLPLPLREGVGGGVRAPRTPPPDPSPKQRGESVTPGVAARPARTYLPNMSEQTHEPAQDRQVTEKPAASPPPKEIGGPKGPEPTRYGDWEVNGRCTDF